HHGHGVREGLQVELQRARTGRLHEPLRQLLRVVGRQPVSVLGGDLDHGLWSQAPVELVVQEHFGQGSDGVTRGTHGESVARKLTIARLVPISESTMTATAACRSTAHRAARGCQYRSRYKAPASSTNPARAAIAASSGCPSRWAVIEATKAPTVTARTVRCQLRMVRCGWAPGSPSSPWVMWPPDRPRSRPSPARRRPRPPPAPAGSGVPAMAG